MFDTSGPRAFGVAPGVDFPRAVVQGLLARMESQPPEALARVEIFVNTRRMARRMTQLFDEGPARLLPQIRLITDLGTALPAAHIPPAISPLGRRLELAQLVQRLIEAQPDLASRASAYDLADSLAALMDEMQGEGVSPERIRALDVTDQSGHWQRSLSFLTIVERFFGTESGEPPDAEARQRQVVEHLLTEWEVKPPTHPILVAGSTGSRGTTALFMDRVARLPQGALILPGFDFHMPAAIWERLDDALASEDHPQYRFQKMLAALEIAPTELPAWTDLEPPSKARNAVLSLALRPAPVTDQWMTEGRRLTDLDAATAAMSLIEAPSPRMESLAIALRLRKAAEDGQRAALISPDRVLTRRVAAALDRWQIEPDDSAGGPLSLSAPGRFLRQVAALFGQEIPADTLMALLKHPLTHSGGDRGPHLRWTREFELWIRRHAVAYPLADLARFEREGAESWCAWLADCLAPTDRAPLPLGSQVKRHLDLAERLAAGAEQTGPGGLWDLAAGRTAREVMDGLATEAGRGGEMTPADYSDLIRAVLGRAEVREPDSPHPGIMFWGTLEARVTGADLVILAGLNDGVWPERPPLDPWLNRQMRLDAGLLLPERRIGLAAHDFQQAAAAPEVVLSRSVRDDEAETVASRWVNRLTNLLDGLPDQGGRAALAAMRARGAAWIQLAEALEAVRETVPPEPRPSPTPPVEARPKRLSVTRIKTLIRDPYAIYAAEILRLRPLAPLRPEPDALLRGTVIHTMLERFLKGEGSKARFLSLADEVLNETVAWPTARRLWLARLARVSDWFLAGEAARTANAQIATLEGAGEMALDGIDFSLAVKADRIDRDSDGRLRIYDYKTGKPPTRSQQVYFDKQLLLTTALAERGAFPDLGPSPVAAAEFIGLGSTPEIVGAPFDKVSADETWEGLHRLIARYNDRAMGYTARLALFTERDRSDYDHLSRFKEWDASDPAERRDVG